MHPFTTSCSATECMFCPVTTSRQECTTKNISEAGSGVPDILPPSGPDETAGERRRGSRQSSGCLNGAGRQAGLQRRESKTLKWSDEGDQQECFFMY